VDVALNWFARGVIVAIVAAAGLRVIPASRARARYAMIWSAYLLVLVLPGIPWILTIFRETPRLDLAPALPLVTMPVAWEVSSTVIIGFWLVWAAVHALQFVRRAIAVQAAKRNGRECPSELLERLQHWTRVSRSGRPVRVVVSDRVRLAGVLACGRPHIAIAPALVGQLNDLDLDRVLVHEWAHVQRRDDIGQLVQWLLRIVVGWHPAAWWCERQLDFEREAACDELAVSVTGSAKGYAGCLALLAALPEASVHSVPALAVLSPSKLHRRVARILRMPRAVTPRPWRAVSLFSAAALVAFTVAIAHVEVAAFSAVSAVMSTTSTAPQRVAGEVTATSRPTELTTRLADGARKPGRVPVVTSAFAQGTADEARPAVRHQEKSSEVSVVRRVEPAATPATEPAPVLASDVHRGLPLSAPAVVRSSESTSTASETSPEGQGRAPWTRAADTGVAVGRASQGAGVATAGFFSRFGKRVAGSF
jgi:beta-lactamase regulating signal transducer with metallopeptidase domain